MLEKAATSLEPCGLQRALPRASRSLRSRRQLYTTFWQHGATEIELGNAWQALMHGVFDAEPDSSQGTALHASSFLFDFLYPTGWRPFDRSDGYRIGQSFAKVTPRLYSSSASQNTAAENKEQGTIRDDASCIATELVLGVPGEDGSDHALYDLDGEAVSASKTGGVDGLLGGPRDSSQNIRQLEELLFRDMPEDADMIWLHYSRLEEESRGVYANQVLGFLSNAGRVKDFWKISELFHHIDTADWDSNGFILGVTAEVNLQNFTKALDVFVKGLPHPNVDLSLLIHAFDLLLAAALKTAGWDAVSLLWQRYPAMIERQGWDFAGITSQLSRVSSVPGLASKVLDHRRSLQRADKSSVDLRKLLVRRALVACADHQVLPLLRMSKDDHLAFEEFLRTSSTERRRKLSVEAYKLYRSLPNVQPSHGALHQVFNAYKDMLHKSAKLAGADLLWGDWHKYNEKPSPRAYRRFLALYASMGQRDQVYKLWKEFVEAYSDVDVLQLNNDFGHLLQVHAVRREPQEAQRIFDEISDRFKCQPNQHCWNILLNAYARAGDYEGAIATFDQISKTIGADSFTFGTLMQMAASRGDLGFTIDLYRRARREKVRPKWTKSSSESNPATRERARETYRKQVRENEVAMLCALVQAYCKNDLYNQAQDVCIRAAKKGIREPRLWNTILHTLALRRDLGGMNHLLSVMTEAGVEYNSFTYQQLLIGLALCRQSQHALHLLSVAIKDNAFEVTPEHFHILMGAFIKSGDTNLALRVHSLMIKCGFEESAESVTQLATAFGQWNKMSASRRLDTSAKELLVASLRRFLKFYPPQTGRLHNATDHAEPSQSASTLLQAKPSSFQFSRMMYLFTQIKDFVKVKELAELYRSVSGNDKLPVSIIESLMLAEMSEGNHDRVEQYWALLFETAKEGARSADYDSALPDAPKVSAQYRYVLCDGLKIMQELLVLRGDASGLQKLIFEVRAEGFELDSQNWNVYVQSLVKLKAYKEAFAVCEKWLMPNWIGWARLRRKANVKNLLPLETRRKGNWLGHRRPTSQTLYFLARGYIELDKMSPWSAEAKSTLREITEDNPRAHRAITTMVRDHSDFERSILEGTGQPGRQTGLGDMDEDYIEDDELTDVQGLREALRNTEQSDESSEFSSSDGEGT